MAGLDRYLHLESKVDLSDRWPMAQSLIESGCLKGMSDSEVLQMLGKEDARAGYFFLFPQPINKSPAELKFRRRFAGGITMFS